MSSIVLFQSKCLFIFALRVRSRAGAIFPVYCVPNRTIWRLYFRDFTDRYAVKRNL
ncbi:hypothetical protein ACE1CD_36475 [Aerosakkonema sp. BLCC-F183]|uniref:hypothetical protein n=1 Tax=Aerosakkonema sp. BLCC-F183 TaxID=3342834 RepID=UPI0035B9814B